MITSDLTLKQNQIFNALCNGLTQAQISRKLRISRSSVSQTANLFIINNLLKKKSSNHYNITYESTIPYYKGIELALTVPLSNEKRYEGICLNCGKRFTTDNKKQIYCNRLCKGEDQSGPNHPSYTGSSYYPYCWMYNTPMKERVKAFFNYRCVMCGKDERENLDRKGRQHKLSIHHVKYNPRACCKGHDKPKDKQFVPLCLICHNKTSRTKDRQMWLEYFSKLIEEVYGGKCYFTKEEFAPDEQYYKF